MRKVIGEQVENFMVAEHLHENITPITLMKLVHLLEFNVELK